MPRRYDEAGHAIIRDNSDRCRDCGGEDRVIAYVTQRADGKETYCQCHQCDPDRGLYAKR